MFNARVTQRRISIAVGGVLLATVALGAASAAPAAADAPLLLTASPENVAVSPDGTRIYVSDNGSTAGVASGRILVFDAKTHAQLALFPDQGVIGARHIKFQGHTITQGGEDVGGYPGALAVSKDGKTVLVANAYGPGSSTAVNLVAFNASNGGFGGMTTLGHAANDIELTPNGQYAFIVDGAFDQVSAVNVGAFPGGTVASTTVPVGQPDSIAFSPDGSRGYVAAVDGTIRVLDTSVSPAQMLKSLAVGGSLTAVAMSRDGRTLYAADNSASGGVVLVDTSSGHVKGKIASGPANGLVLDSARGLGFVADFHNNAVVTVDLASGRVIGRAHVGKGPRVMAVNDRFGELYVVNQSSGTVSIVAIPSARPVTQAPAPTQTPSATPQATPSATGALAATAPTAADSPLVLVLIGLAVLVLIVMVVVVVLLLRRRST